MHINFKLNEKNVLLLISNISGVEEVREDLIADRKQAFDADLTLYPLIG